MTVTVDGIGEKHGLRTDEPPHDGSHIVAWAIDQHAHGYDVPGEPRWVIAQWIGDLPESEPYWRWQTPGLTTRVVILGWLPLPPQSMEDTTEPPEKQEKRDA